MGVHGLWNLIAPVGRRVSVETLAGKRLAIDASIWMVQFMKAMRDEKGEMVRNAHLLGFFRRICKLLFLRSKPVFVFDGGTPALKRRTVIARRRQRENAQAKVRKTAEKLLMSHLKAMRLKNLAEDLKDQRAKNDKGKEVMLDQSNTKEKNGDLIKGHKQEMIDEMLVASILAEEGDGFNGSTSTSKAAIGSINGDASASAACLTEDEDDDNGEEMILPLTNGNVDPAVLAALPPSMQLDLLSQMRERLMAENRQKYQKVKKAPQRFSELQIEAYLKTVAFRREINQVQRAAAGKGVAGVHTSRIASEANREFIFSSSFSGDKHLLASVGAEINPEQQKRIGEKDSSLDILNSIASVTNTNPVAGAIDDKLVGDLSNEVQTFLDEKGRMRVSRRRAMGIRMTRDLQRNIDLLKELEQESVPNILEKTQINIDEKKDLSGKSYCEGQTLKVVDDFDGETVQNIMDKSLVEAEIRTSSKTCINISFIDDGEDKPVDADDELFCHLVAGNRVSICSADNSASDCDWEEGVVGKGSGDGHENKLKENSSHAKDGNSESDVEWEEGTSVTNVDKSEMKSFHVDDSKPNENTVECLEGATDIRAYIPEISTTVQKAVSKGSVEEEVALQEAIRRSLEDLTGGKTSIISSELLESDYTCKRSLRLESHSPEPSSKQGSVLHDNEIFVSLAAESGGSSVVAGKNDHAPTSAGMHSGSAAAITTAEGEETASPTCTANESTQIGDTCMPTHASGADSLHATFVTDMRKNKQAAPSICSSGEVSDSCTGRAASVMKEQERHTDVKSNMAKEDIFPADSQERGNVDESSAFKDEDDFIELVDASLEDELLALGQEYRNLGDEQKKLERNVDSVNAEMFVECQELLQMFGLPYIIAPMEAEAQCAYLEFANLVDGVVTDDSDVFLFGARSVYKNIFDDRKYVETYFMKDIESELGLNREKLIRMALLLGSDYTEGVSGIGIVNAIEVVNAFPEEDGLYKFREWVESPDPTILGKTGVQPGSTSKRRGSKDSKRGKSDSKCDLEGTSISDCNALDKNEDNQDIDDNKSLKQVFMNKHRNVSKNWHISASFPSDAVISAYTDPQVDKSTEPFTWGKPDIFLLRKLCWEKIGWANQKADELLLPVLKEYNKRETQLRLEAFYTFNERFAKIRSKRIKQAVKGITGKRSSELASNDDLKGAPKKIKRRKGNIGDSKTENKEPITEGDDCIVGEMSNPAKKLTSQPKRRGSKDGLTSMTEERRSNGTGSSRVRGRQKAKSIGRGRRKDDPDSEVDEPSIHVSSCSSDGHEFELPAKKAQVADSVRRSKRAKRDISYAENDEESDKPTDLLTGSSKKCTNDEAPEQQLSNFQNIPKDNVPTSSRETELTSQDPFPGDGFNGDYLVEGGGFCADEDELETENNDGSIQNKETSFEADVDYLLMGGGFCIDEDEDEEAREETQAPVNVSDQSDLPIAQETAPDEIQALSKALELNLSDKKDTNTPNVADNSKDVTPSSMSVFSAIPFFKRKRRRN